MHTQRLESDSRIASSHGRVQGVAAMPPGRAAATSESPEPMYLRREGKQLFAWLHRAAAASSPALGLVICNPFGYEEVCAHRSVARIAEAAANVGVPVLRFDFEDCGHSQGDDSSQSSVEGWTNCVHGAIDALKAATGLTRVCVLGLRLGATLAALACVEREDIDGFIAMAPVVKGRAYLRELRVLLLSNSAGQSAPEHADGAIEAAGFVLSAAVRRGIESLDLAKLAKLPAQSVLLLDRDDLPTAKDFAESMRARNAEVDVRTWQDYARLMTDPQTAHLPAEAVDAISQTLKIWRQRAEGRAERTTAHAGAAVPSSSRVVTDEVEERIVSIPSGTTELFGVLAQPADQAAQQRVRKCVLMLNAGSVHSIGPNRQWVRLSRRWAAQGLASVRLDIAGIGDSPAHVGAAANVVYSPRAVEDVAAATAAARKMFPLAQIEVLGLCSGAYHAFKTAVAGHEIAGAIIVNPLTFNWNESEASANVQEYEYSQLTSKYRRALFTLDPWVRLFNGQLELRTISAAVLGRLRSLAKSRLMHVGRAIGWRLRSDLVEDLRSAVRHGAKLKFVFSDTDPGLAMLQSQSGRALEELKQRGHVQVHVVPRADHTFSMTDAQSRLCDLLTALVVPSSV